MIILLFWCLIYTSWLFTTSW